MDLFEKVSQDRNKLLKLHSELQQARFTLPTDFDDEEIQVVVNTVSEGILTMQKWLEEQARKKFVK